MSEQSRANNILVFFFMSWIVHIVYIQLLPYKIIYVNFKTFKSEFLILYELKQLQTINAFSIII